jgi:hypothetical protein
MKKILLAIAVVGLFGACSSADQATVDAMADDMCAVMDKMDPEDPMSLLEVAGDMMEVAAKEEYGTVSEKQFRDAMGAKCPDGLKKFEDLENME